MTPLQTTADLSVLQRPVEESFQPTAESESAFNENNLISPEMENDFIQDRTKPSPNSLQSLFQSINQEAVDRPLRTKQPDISGAKAAPKSSALDKLVSIAGADWDNSLHTSHSLLDSSFSCPSLSGHFPDRQKCSVYYQCAEGVAHSNTCQQGLLYNMVTNTCDWQQNVDCEVNKGNKDVPTVAEVEQAVTISMSKPFTAFGL